MAEDRRLGIRQRRGLGPLRILSPAAMGYATHLMARGARHLMAPQKPRAPVKPRTSTKKGKSKTKRGRVKIGAYAGKLIASKPVSVPKAGARIRNRVFGSVEQPNKVWLTGSTMGNEKYYSSLASEALITHLLRESKDYRADKGSTESGVVLRYEVRFMADDARKAVGQEHVMRMNCTVDPSFNGMVYNPLGALGNSVTIDGAIQPVGTSLVQVMFEQALAGYYPAGITSNRDSFDDGSQIYRDVNFNKALISLVIHSTFKFQNITPSDGTAGDNVNAIDANPLQGKIATFRNQSPTWNKGWLSQNPVDANDLTNFSGRSDSLATWDYPQTSTFPFPATSVEEFRAMPLRMRTVFANAKTSTPVYFPPGGYKDFKTTFTFKGTLFKFMRDSTQLNLGVTGADVVAKYPPLGDSFALCLVPTMKSIAGEVIKVAFDYHRDGSAHIIKYRGGTLPTTNQIQ